MDNRNITQHDLENAKRLQRLWTTRKRELGLTQIAAGKKLGCNQSMVSQLLSGRVALNTDHTLKWAQLLNVSPGDIDPNLSGLGFSTVALRRIKVPVLSALSGAATGAFEIVEIFTRMTKQVYGISVDDESLGAYARKGSTLIVSQEEEPISGDEVFLRLKLGDRFLNSVKQFVMVDNSRSVAVVRDLLTQAQEEIQLDTIELMDPIVSIERPVVNRPTRLRPSTPARA